MGDTAIGIGSWQARRTAALAAAGALLVVAAAGSATALSRSAEAALAEQGAEPMGAGSCFWLADDGTSATQEQARAWVRAGYPYDVRIDPEHGDVFTVFTVPAGEHGDGVPLIAERQQRMAGAQPTTADPCSVV
jgi:hypothetical protein